MGSPLLRILTYMVALACAALAQASDCPSSDLRNSTKVESDHYQLYFRFDPWPPKLGAYHSVYFQVCGKNGEKVHGKVLIDAAMPVHRHGMNTKPIVKKLNSGKYLGEGLLFHMAGKWQLFFDIQRPPATERATFTFEIE